MEHPSTIDANGKTGSATGHPEQVKIQDRIQGTAQDQSPRLAA